MTNTEVRVIKLACVSCGSSLDISQSMNRLACGHCGTQQIVERTGGAIHLRGVAEALSKVQVGTDKTAAELAINRISKELEALHHLRVEKEHYWLNSKTQRLFEWNTLFKSRESSVTAITAVAAIVAGFPMLIIAIIFLSMFEAIFQMQGKGMMPTVIVFFIGCITAGMFGRKIMQKSDKYNPQKLHEDCNKDIAKLDRQAARDIGEVDKNIMALNDKLQQNYRIANA